MICKNKKKIMEKGENAGTSIYPFPTVFLKYFILRAYVAWHLGPAFE